MYLIALVCSADAHAQIATPAPPSTLFEMNGSVYEKGYVGLFFDSYFPQSFLLNNSLSPVLNWNQAIHAERALDRSTLKGDAFSKGNGKNGGFTISQKSKWDWQHPGGGGIIYGAEIGGGVSVNVYVRGAAGTPFVVDVSNSTSVVSGDAWGASYQVAEDGRQVPLRGKVHREGVSRGEPILYQGTQYTYATRIEAPCLSGLAFTQIIGVPSFHRFITIASNVQGQVQLKNAVPRLSVSSTPLDFGAVRLNQSKTLTLRVTNVGDPGSHLIGNLRALPRPFALAGTNKFDLEAGESQFISVKFQPTAIRMNKVDGFIESNDPNTPVLQKTMQGATEARFKLWLKAFIPQNIDRQTFLVSKPPFKPVPSGPFPPVPAAYANLTAIADPMFELLAYTTDQRGWSDAKGEANPEASARVTLAGEFVVKGYNRFSKESPVLKSDPTHKVIYTRGKVESATGKPIGGWGNITKLQDGVFQVPFVGAASNPFFEMWGRNPAPAINFNGKLKFDFIGGQLSSDANVDDFPAFEMFFKTSEPARPARQLFHYFNAKNSVIDLFPDVYPFTDLNNVLQNKSF